MDTKHGQHKWRTVLLGTQRNVGGAGRAGMRRGMGARAAVAWAVGRCGVEGEVRCVWGPPRG